LVFDLVVEVAQVGAVFMLGLQVGVCKVGVHQLGCSRQGVQVVCVMISCFPSFNGVSLSTMKVYFKAPQISCLLGRVDHTPHEESTSMWTSYEHLRRKWEVALSTVKSLLRYFDYGEESNSCSNDFVSSYSLTGVRDLLTSGSPTGHQAISHKMTTAGYVSFRWISTVTVFVAYQILHLASTLECAT
jgi:hypothetical protein